MRPHEHNLYMFLPASISSEHPTEWLYNLGHDFVEFLSLTVPNSSTFLLLSTFKGLRFTTQWLYPWFQFSKFLDFYSDQALHIMVSMSWHLECIHDGRNFLNDITLQWSMKHRESEIEVELGYNLHDLCLVSHYLWHGITSL